MSQTIGELLEQMRYALLNQGNGRITHLTIDSPYCYSNADFVKECIDEFEHKVCIGYALGERLNPLEQLAVYVLFSSADLEWPRLISN